MTKYQFATVVACWTRTPGLTALANKAGEIKLKASSEALKGDDVAIKLNETLNFGY